MSSTPWGLTNYGFNFSFFSNFHTRDFKKNLNTRSDLTTPFKPSSQKKLILKNFINLGQKMTKWIYHLSTWPQGVDDNLSTYRDFIFNAYSNNSKFPIRYIMLTFATQIKNFRPPNLKLHNLVLTILVDYFFFLSFSGKQCFFVLRQQQYTVQCIAYVSEDVSKQMIKFISQ